MTWIWPCIKIVHMNSRDIRKKYLSYFISHPRNHMEIPSASLVPENDPTTLFTSSGMQPLIQYLLGDIHPLGTRIVDSQKCFRSQDISEVGDNRHTTFFEMLGNWSLGDYFKKEQLGWFFNFLTEELKLDPQRLYVSVFEGDKNFKLYKNELNQPLAPDVESVAIWKKIFAGAGITAAEGERIFFYPATKNWWSRSGAPPYMPPGEPGGPDSEVFYEFTDIAHDPKYGARCHPNCDCGRFLEIGNSVFMQYQKRSDGNFSELPKKNVDFGGGLERLVAATENKSDIFSIDLFATVISAIAKVSGKSYEDNENKTAMRIIADHIKASVFLIADGVEPSNRLQGYVLRRLLRRSAIKMHQLSEGFTTNPDFSEICGAVLEIYDKIYFDAKNVTIRTDRIIKTEMDKFTSSISKGLKVLDKTTNIDGKIAFDLYQSFGFPLEITKELAEQKGVAIDEEEFKKEFVRHQELSRTASRGMFRGGLSDSSRAVTKLHTATHLLQQALRTILGEHVRQRGSHITGERLRFDFSHEAKLSEVEIIEVENLVNQKIKQNLPVTMKIVDLDAAVSAGALTVPGAKYPQKVKVYTVGDPMQVFSREVCGGPHVDFTGNLGTFKIIKEEAAGTNTRRIYANLS